MARDQAARLLKSDRAQELLGQVRGPILSAGKDAALSMFESQAGRLSENLQRRTDRIGDTLEDTGRRTGRAARTGTGTAARLTERRRRSAEPDDEAEDDETLDDEEEPVDEDAYEYEDEAEYDEEPADGEPDDEEAEYAEADAEDLSRKR
jgi:hypothetical protein